MFQKSSQFNLIKKDIREEVDLVFFICWIDINKTQTLKDKENVRKLSKISKLHQLSSTIGIAKKYVSMRYFYN